MGRVIAIANQKGGVGKTTTSVNLGTSLAVAERKTLAIDCDPQGHMTVGLGFVKGEERRTVYECLIRGESVESVVMGTEVEGLDVVAADRNLVGAAVELVGMEEREYRLKRALEGVREKYNFVLLDCPPSLDLLTLNALAAADSVLVPIQCEYFALEGVSELVGTIERVRQSINPNLELEGILLTMYDERTTLARQVAADVRATFGSKVFQTVIPRNVRLAEAPSHGKAAMFYDMRSKGAIAYLDLAKEVVANGEKCFRQGA